MTSTSQERVLNRLQIQHFLANPKRIKVVKCPRCKGKKKIWRLVSEDCHNCNGAGVIKTKRREPDVCGKCNGHGAVSEGGIGSAMRDVICSDCGGSGRKRRDKKKIGYSFKTKAKKRCTRCGGSGKLYPDNKQKGIVVEKDCPKCHGKKYTKSSISTKT